MRIEERRARTIWETRQRVPVPYPPWDDQPIHIDHAKRGLCYVSTCESIAHHGWKNLGMGEAKYCLYHVRRIGECNPSLFQKVELSPEFIQKNFREVVDESTE